MLMFMKMRIKGFCRNFKKYYRVFVNSRLYDYNKCSFIYFMFVCPSYIYKIVLIYC